MFLRRLLLRNFRNYRLLDLPLEPGITVLFGPNAHGKTNLLEAIYFLATAESPRTHETKDLIRLGASDAVVKGRMIDRGREEVLEIRVLPGRKVAKVGGEPLPRLSDFVGRLVVVLFTADDLQIVKGPPELRRAFLDLWLSQGSVAYRHALSAYRRALQGRNHLLKLVAEGRYPEEVLDQWDQQVASHGARVLKLRLKAVEEMAEHAKEGHRLMGGGELEVRYKATVPLEGDFTSSFLAALREGRMEDLEKGATQVGPHRDDLEIFVNGRECRYFCSQGEQRTVALALRYAEFKWLWERRGTPPVLLLDDVMSELDRRRRERVAELAVQAEQTIITCTEPEAIPEPLLGRARLMRVQGGEVRPT